MEGGLDHPNHLRFGIVLPSRELAPVQAKAGIAITRRRFEAFCSSLSVELGIKVWPLGFEDYRGVLQAIHNQDVDFAWLPPLMALRSGSQGRTIPVVLPVRAGSAEFWSALFSRADSDIASVHDLVGVRAAWVDNQSASGYLVVQAWLRNQSIEFDRAFSDESFLGTHQAVVHSVVEETADVGATFAHVGADGLIETAGWGSAEVNVVALVGPVPADVVAARVRLDATMIRRMRDCLVQGVGNVQRSSNRLFESEGFIPAESNHGAALTDLLQHLSGLGGRRPSIFPPSGGR